MKMRLIDIVEGDYIYYMGDLLFVDKCLLISHCLHCTNVKTKRFALVTSPFVNLFCRQLTLF